MNGWNTINLDADLYEYLECLSYKQEIDPNIAKLLFVEPIWYEIDREYNII